MHIPALGSASRAFSGLALAAVLGVQGCARTDEAAMRALAERWFAVGEGVGFAAQSACAAGVYRLVDTQVGAGLQVFNDVGRALSVLEVRGAVALGVDGSSPDETLTAIVAEDRPLGFRLKAIALEARLCMDDVILSAFGHALTSSDALLAYDRNSAALMLLDPGTGLLVVAMGAG